MDSEKSHDKVVNKVKDAGLVKKPGKEKLVKKLKNMVLLVEEGENDDLESLSNEIEDNQYFRICTRSSPAQLYRCVNLLKENQKKSVVNMGFGSLLNFMVDGISGRLAH
ncbi:hypothetical protein R6Q57_002946 [Mikania cordata]